MQFLDKFSKIKVLVVGDVMLDRYWWGDVDRISPEAPVPVVRLSKTTIIAGGAANVAANVAGLGAQPFLVGIVGNDEEAKLFPKVLKDSMVSAEFLVELAGRPTTVKTRVVAHSQQIVRLDQETNSPISVDEEASVWKKLEGLIDRVDIVIVSDYAKGLLTESLLKRIISAGNEKNIQVLVDPKGKNYAKYKGATLLTPNKKEAAEACQLEETGNGLIFSAGKKLMSDIETEAILITQGEDGLTLFEKDDEPIHLDAIARDVYDVTGAGDTFIATLAVAMGAGTTLVNAAELANFAAGVVVEQIGTTAIKLNDLQKSEPKSDSMEG
jgi:D-beta-D-heptose 7-phosphate kinase/D-beta-D-heptose 1-phosphate adenosyltransferase